MSGAKIKAIESNQLLDWSHSGLVSHVDSQTVKGATLPMRASVYEGAAVTRC